MAEQVLGGRYRIVRHLARGGMAEVYLAHDELLERPVAVKVLFPELARDASFVERFRREAQSAARLNHPNIVSVFDFGEDADGNFIVMEYVAGPTLSDVIGADGPMAPSRAVAIGADIAAALAAAHREGIVHRDVKPANVLLADGVAKVADFGIARAADSRAGLTLPGMIIGTANYLSPEQAQGLPVDHRTDLYSLGMVLYEMLTGRPPFTGDNPIAVAYQQQHESALPPSSRNRAVSPRLDAIVAELLSLDPVDRPSSADQVRAELLAAGDDPMAGQPTVAFNMAETSVVPIESVGGGVGGVEVGAAAAAAAAAAGGAAGAVAAGGAGGGGGAGGRGGAGRMGPGGDGPSVAPTAMAPVAGAAAGRARREFPGLLDPAQPDDASRVSPTPHHRAGCAGTGGAGRGGGHRGPQSGRGVVGHDRPAGGGDVGRRRHDQAERRRAEVPSRHVRRARRSRPGDPAGPGRRVPGHTRRPGLALCAERHDDDHHVPPLHHPSHAPRHDRDDRRAHYRHPPRDHRPGNGTGGHDRAVHPPSDHAHHVDPSPAGVRPDNHRLGDAPPVPPRSGGKTGRQAPSKLCHQLGRHIGPHARFDLRQLPAESEVGVECHIGAAISGRHQGGHHRRPRFALAPGLSSFGPEHEPVSPLVDLRQSDPTPELGRHRPELDLHHSLVLIAFNVSYLRPGKAWANALHIQEQVPRLLDWKVHVEAIFDAHRRPW